MSGPLMQIPMSYYKSKSCCSRHEKLALEHNITVRFHKNSNNNNILFSNLCLGSWYEHRRSHFKCQISEIPLLDHILHRHPVPNTYGTMLTLYPVHYIIGLHISMWWSMTWRGVWHRASKSVLLSHDWGAPSTCPSQDFQSVRGRQYVRALKCGGGCWHSNIE